MALKMIPWYVEFELDGTTHVIKATAPAPNSSRNHTEGKDPEEFLRERIQRMHPGMKITVLRPAKEGPAGMAEFVARAKELREDPNHIPLDAQSLKEDRATVITQNPI